VSEDVRGGEARPASAERLASLLAQLSYREGIFRLASGRESDFYVDVKQTVFRAEGAALVGSLLCDRLEAHGIELVGGMAVGAIPLTVVALVEAARRGRALDGFFVRKDVKDHGTARRIDGRFDPAATIALVEDVVTTGESTLSAVDAVEAAGGRVSLVVTVVDRQEDDGLARLATRVPAVEALASRASILAAVQLRA
jgi:orotate phosphoribosyltransferase